MIPLKILFEVLGWDEVINWRSQFDYSVIHFVTVNLEQNFLFLLFSSKIKVEINSTVWIITYVCEVILQSIFSDKSSSRWVPWAEFVILETMNFGIMNWFCCCYCYMFVLFVRHVTPHLPISYDKRLRPLFGGESLRVLSTEILTLLVYNVDTNS